MINQPGAMASGTTNKEQHNDLHRRVTLVKHVTFGFGGHANPPIYVTSVEYLGADEAHLNFEVPRNTLKLANSVFTSWGKLTK